MLVRRVVSSRPSSLALVVFALSGPALADEPVPGLAPSTARTVEMRHAGWSRTRPRSDAARFGMIRGGTRLAVRGQVPARAGDPCRAELWWAVEPMGFICGRDAVPTGEPPGGEPVLALRPGRRVPYSYAIVRAESLPGFQTPDDVRAGRASKSFSKGMMLAVRGYQDVDGVAYVRSWERLLVRQDGVRGMGSGSTWVGERLGPGTKLPFGWTVPRRARVYRDPTSRPDPARVPRRTRVDVVEERGDFVRTPLGWLRAADVAVVRRISPPAGVDARGKWIDVDVGEQTLVAYEGSTPVYATLISSGTSERTPLGNYPIWAKVASIDMDNQEGDENVYTVQRVPWVLFFQEHNALHGAYWHDRFGSRASHGCVNLAPADARMLFDWALPPLSPGWEGFMPEDLSRSVVVHIRNSARIPPFEQQARIGPPRE
ncbi:MAG: L,D-transpeptidase [Deltaproteobacteria bacterium]|nr:L,D-transpeptidase [Deltaproteobacteria bacterium]